MNYRALFLGAVLASLAGTAWSQTAGQALTNLSSVRPDPRPAIDLSGPHAVNAFSDPEADAQRAAGLARTSVDRRLGDDKVVGAFGFLCGREPGHSDTGSASAFGYDPHGRFLGAKLSRSF